MTARVPAGWSTAKIGDVTAKPLKCEPVSTGRDRVRYVDIGQLEGPTSDLSDAPEIDSQMAPSRCRQVLAGGDTLYSTVRPYLRKIAFVQEAMDGEFASTGYCVLRPVPEIHPRFLYYFTLSKQFEDQLLPLQKGVSYPAVLDREVRGQRIWYPGLPEQRRIVEILEDHLSHLDAATRDLALASSRAASLRLSCLDQLVVGTPRLLAEMRLGADYGTSTKCNYDGLGPAVLRIPNLREGVIDESDLKFAVDSKLDLSASMVSTGDVLIVRTNGSRSLIGRSAVVGPKTSAAFASYLIRYRVDPDQLMPEWMHMALESPRIREELERRAASSAGQHNLSLGKLDSLDLPCPDLATQRARWRELSALDEDLRRTRDVVGSSTARGEALRHAVLAAAFEGKLTGRHTDQEVIEELAAV